MIYTVAPDWTFAKLRCADCGASIGAELSEEEATRLRRDVVAKRHEIPIGRSRQTKLRTILRAQLETWFRQRGCPHVGRT